jgi:hypothetical protein
MAGKKTKTLRARVQKSGRQIGTGILSRPGGEPGRITVEAGTEIIDQIRAIDRDLETIIKHCVPEVVTQIEETRDMARTAIESVRAKVQVGTGRLIV